MAKYEFGKAKGGVYSTPFAYSMGLAIGGLVFGLLADSWGRVKTIASAIFVCALSSAMIAIAGSWMQYLALLLLAGVGAGGVLTAGSAFILESLDPKSRGWILGAITSVTFLAGLSYSVLFPFVYELGWRNLCWFAALPALLTCVIPIFLREPQAWTQCRERERSAAGKKSMPLKSLLLDPIGRKHLFLGLVLAGAGALILNGSDSARGEVMASVRQNMGNEVAGKTIGNVALAAMAGKFFGALFATILTAHPNKLSVRTCVKCGVITAVVFAVLGSCASVFLVLKYAFLVPWLVIRVIAGAVQWGIVAFIFSLLAGRFGRKATLAISFVSACASGALLFILSPMEPHNLFLLLGLLGFMLGFCSIMPLGVLAIYLPELFHMRFRATGVGLCYGLPRLVGTATSVLLIGAFLPARNAGSLREVVLMICFACCIGLVALKWSTETKNRSLPEEAAADKLSA